MTNDDAGAQDDDDGEKKDELELMLLLGANERRLGRRSGPDNGWMGTRREQGTAATLSRKLIPQLEHYLSLNGTGRHHLSTLVGRRCCGQTRSRE